VSLAFPAISTGIYGYPRAEAAAVASATISRFLANDTQLKELRMVFFQDTDAEIFLENQRFE
jgi:O-acetyl-ADP-ribose deacetylase (regulator of RNase III)